MSHTIYLKMKPRIRMNGNEVLTVGDIAQIIGIQSLRKKLSELEVHQLTTKGKPYFVVDVMEVITIIKNVMPHVDVQTIGAAQTVVKVSHSNKSAPAIVVTFVWLLLFVGSGLAIMNFHEDVSMSEVHQKIYYLITGTKKEFPLILQIPYSLGLGLGMILFFNYLFNKKFNEEPGPLEVEVFKYEQDLEQFVVDEELRNEKNR